MGAVHNVSFSEDAIVAGRRLFAQPVAFIKGALTLADVPASTLPEIAFAGRSNVGKSSLINALTGRSGLARRSNTPGRTREINFFDLGGRLMIADLPGYGFAAAPKEKVSAWTDLIKLYLKGRPTLRRALLLIDARHGPKAADRDMMAMLDDAAVNYQIILTKTDKVNPTPLAELARRMTAECAQHVAAHPDVLMTSAASGDGLPIARAALSELAAPE